MHDKIQDSADATKYFSFASRNHVGAGDKALSQRAESREAWDMWETWVQQAIDAVRRLYELGYVHGAISPAVLRVDDSLKLGGLQHVRPRGSLPPLDVFHANTLYTPPELLLYWGAKQGIPFSNMAHALKQENWPMDQIETFFPEHTHTDTVLHSIYTAANTNITDLDEASSVWMLGYSLLTVYATMLQNAFAINSEFYKNRHVDFLNLIGAMVHPDPSKRPKISELIWSVPSVVETTAAAETVVDSTAETVKPSVRYRRLALSAPSDPAGRNKTRRNPRS
jgi:hypothetical protein